MPDCELFDLLFQCYMLALRLISQFLFRQDLKTVHQTFPHLINPKLQEPDLNLINLDMWIMQRRILHSERLH